MPDDGEAREAELAKVRIGPMKFLDGPVELHEYDPRWPDLFAREEQRIRRLRAHPGDRDRYAPAKRDLAARRWRHMQDYADAKTDIVEKILRRAADET